MTRDEETAVVAAWRSFTAGRPVNRQTYLDFIELRIRGQARFQRLSVFEVLDALVNAEPETEPETAPIRATA